jgi:putative N6-adenine-specific DNA methylase
LAKLQLIAATAMGLEALAARELRQLGYTDMMVENGKITFAAEEKDICRTNLWLRTADRILVKMAEFPARTFEELFQGVKAVPWHEWIPEDGEFPVEGRSQKSLLSSVPACQAVVKKAVVEKMKQHYRKEWFPETGPRYVIEVSLLNDLATITLDTTGPSLHKRGYRKLVTEAPLKETLAAAMVMLSRWTPDRPLYDPFCGSGTIPIEAALIGWNIAPGLRRSFPSERWHRVPESMWQLAREEAIDLAKDDVKLDIFGSDIDPEAIRVAEAAVKKAGLSGEIRLETLPVSRMKPRGDYGVIVTNPPYGERLGTPKEVEAVLRQFASRLQQLPTWSTFVLSPAKHLEHLLERKADKKRKLYNGRIECQLYQYFGPRGAFEREKFERAAR